MDDIPPPPLPRPLTWLPRVAPLKPPSPGPPSHPPGKVSRPFPQVRVGPGPWPGHTAPAPTGCSGSGIQGRGTAGCRLAAPPTLDTALEVTAHTLWTDRQTCCAGTDRHRGTDGHRAPGATTSPRHTRVSAGLGAVCGCLGTLRRSGVGVPIPRPPPWDGWDTPAPFTQLPPPFRWRRAISVRCDSIAPAGTAAPPGSERGVQAGKLAWHPWMFVCPRGAGVFSNKLQ